ncbi:GGDEF domain-containing protein [Sinimarinibacterium sp. CAU 1509]|uniref:GGDEF domain-containing protein n=1 Tax=Sinimarinibacterium sp. CAU 1509 TaxID=2562283 RepID=UPI0010AD3309|nr:GGDEF domain-containing protein [Sinimarinibacterium sp. CAU 1509]TJY58274.1 GGDEF domain-containing protein [Sinimarinibacterium sp. CAU 1509]
MLAKALSNRPDFALIAQLRRADHAVLVCAALLGGGTALLWLFPVLRTWAPPGWELMKFNTAACLLLGAASAALQSPDASTRQGHIGRLLALIIVLLSAATLAEWFTQLPVSIDQWAVRDPYATRPGRMSIQTSFGFLLVGITLGCIRFEKGVCGLVSDALSILVLGLVSVVAAGYLFDATHLFGTDALTRMSPQTLIGFACMAFVFGVRRARQGYSDVLVGIGIGSRIARLLLPVGLLTPVLLAIAQTYVVARGWLDPAYAAALRAAILSMLILLLVLWMAHRINDLEAELRTASLTDELTGISNRRGFTVLAEQMLRGERRNAGAATLYFIDIDGLKTVNDRQGHEAGSALIRTVADVLRSEFRDSDVIGRIGGDEFCVLVSGSMRSSEDTIQRLRQRARGIRELRQLPFEVRFSIGAAAVDPMQEGALETAMRDADQRMYAIKKQRKAAQTKKPEIEHEGAI